MKGFSLNSATLDTIQASTGLEMSAIVKSDLSAIESHVEKQIGTILKPALNVGNLQARGSVYLMFKRLFTAKEIDCKLDKIKP